MLRLASVAAMRRVDYTGMRKEPGGGIRPASTFAMTPRLWIVRQLSRWISLKPRCHCCGRPADDLLMHSTIREIATGGSSTAPICFRCLTRIARSRGLPAKWYLQVHAEAWPAWTKAIGQPSFATIDRSSGRIKIPGRALAPMEQWRSVLRADPCAYCGEPSATVDHIVALGASGQDKWDNLTGACKSCNTQKATHPLWQFLMVTRRYEAIEWARKAQGDKRVTPFDYASLLSRCRPRKPQAAGFRNSPRIKVA